MSVTKSCFSWCLSFPLLTVDQTTDIVLYSADKYTKGVFNQEFGYVDRELKVENHNKYQVSSLQFDTLIFVFYSPQRDSGA